MRKKVSEIRKKKGQKDTAEYRVVDLSQSKTGQNHSKNTSASGEQ